MRGMAPKLGLNPTMPLNAAGLMIEPSVWVPSASGTSPAATAAAEPDEDPPGVWSRFQGLTVGPGRRAVSTGRYSNAFSPGSSAFVFCRRPAAYSSAAGWLFPNRRRSSRTPASDLDTGRASGSVMPASPRTDENAIEYQARSRAPGARAYFIATAGSMYFFTTKAL